MINIDEINEKYSKGCECGRKHRIDIKEIVIEEKALDRVPELLNSLTQRKKIYLIADTNTYRAAGEHLNKILGKEGYLVKPVVLEGKQVKPDTDYLYKILDEVANDGYLIACGSGSINDMVKYLAYKFNHPYMIVGTAPSMDGYSSVVSVLTVQGYKTTYEVKPPEAVVLDLDILSTAPREMIQAGAGDLLGKVTSLLDWKMSHLLFGEYFCEEIFSLIEAQLAELFPLAGKLKNRDQQSIKALTEGLVYSGLAMQMAGNSRPASGSEHHVSHFLEMTGLLHQKRVPLHGNQVGLGVYYTSRLYLGLRDLNFKDLEIEKSKEDRIQRIKRAYGDYSKPILENLDKRLKIEKLSRELLIEKEESIKKGIEEFSHYLEDIGQIVKDIGLLEREDIRALYSNGWLEKALRYSFEYRPRFTVATLLYLTGLLDRWVDDLLFEYV